MALDAEAERAVRSEFRKFVNMSAGEIKAWLETDESKKVGMVRRGEKDSAGPWASPHPAT